MTKSISVGEGDPIPGREQILEDEQEGWEIFCTFCVEFLTAMLNQYHLFKWEETARQIALGVTTKVFLAFKKNPETLANMNTAEEIMRYLRRCAWIYRKAAAIVEEMLAHKPMTPEEAEEQGIDLNKNPQVFGLAFPDPERATIACEVYALVRQARSQLSPKRAETLARAVWGDSHKEIAEALGMKNEHAVGQELNRTRQDLIKLLPKDSIPELELFVGRQLRKLRGEQQVSALAS
jgi:DNA-directed RNA polymerase specialized sigma24 family protein